MKSPKWAYFVGIMMIIVGSCSVNKHVQSLKVPELIDMKNDILEDMSIEINSMNMDSISMDDATYEELKEFEDLMSVFTNLGTDSDEILRISAFAEKWLVGLGYAGIVFAIIYILGGLMLLIPKPSSIQIAYIGLGLGLLFNIAHWIVMSLDPEPGWLSQSSAYVNIVGITIDAILLAVVYFADKSVFNPVVEE